MPPEAVWTRRWKCGNSGRRGVPGDPTRVTRVPACERAFHSTDALKNRRTGWKGPRGFLLHRSLQSGPVNPLKSGKRTKVPSVTLQQWKRDWVDLPRIKGRWNAKIIEHIRYFKLVNWLFPGFQGKKQTACSLIKFLFSDWVKKANSWENGNVYIETKSSRHQSRVIFIKGVIKHHL